MDMLTILTHFILLRTKLYYIVTGSMGNYGMDYTYVVNKACAVFVIRKDLRFVSFNIT